MNYICVIYLRVLCSAEHGLLKMLCWSALYQVTAFGRKQRQLQYSKFRLCMYYSIHEWT